MQKLSLRGCALTFGVIWCAAVLFCGLANMIWTGYAEAFIQVVASVYPGYKGTGEFVDVIVGSAYAFVDGLVCGLLVAVLYNLFSTPKPAGAGQPI